MNGHSESASELDETSSGPKTSTGTAETAHGQKVSMTSHGKSAFVHETANGPWNKSATCETGHATPPDQELAQRHPSQASRPRKGEDREEREQEPSSVDSPISQECDRRSRPAETEEATEEGSASTSDSYELEDPATPTPRREEAAESLAPPKAEGLAPTPYSPTKWREGEE